VAAPEPKAQRNFTDPESRILKTKDGYIQGYNAQAAVDAHAQIIVAHTLGNNGSNQNQFAPLLDAIKTNLGSNPDEVSADAGYCSTPIDAIKAATTKTDEHTKPSLPCCGGTHDHHRDFPARLLAQLSAPGRQHPP
jgi:Transposase DDE domain